MEYTDSSHPESCLESVQTDPVPSSEHVELQVEEREPR